MDDQWDGYLDRETVFAVLGTHEPSSFAGSLSCEGCDWQTGEISWTDHLIAALEPPPPPPTRAFEPIRGEVGVLAGIPIMGTNDVVNAGPPRIPRELDYETGMAKLASEVEPHPYQPGAALNYICMRCGASLDGGNHIP